MITPFKPMVSHMGAFHIRPKIRFESQHEKEDVILMLRSHPITQVPWLLKAFGMLCILILIDFVIPIYLSSIQTLFINLFFICGILSYGWLNIILYYFTVGIVTNERVLDVDFHGILTKEVTETRIRNVEDITSKMMGYIGALFHFGNVHVQTAGTENNIEFLQVPDPSFVVKIINSLLEETKQ